jgi:hypothetical protein
LAGLVDFRSAQPLDFSAATSSQCDKTNCLDGLPTHSCSLRGRKPLAKPPIADLIEPHPAFLICFSADAANWIASAIFALNRVLHYGPEQSERASRRATAACNDRSSVRSRFHVGSGLSRCHVTLKRADVAGRDLTNRPATKQGDYVTLDPPFIDFERGRLFCSSST